MTRRNVYAASRIPLIEDAGGRPGQIGMVVRDLDEGLRTWGAGAHTRPAWRIWKYSAQTMRSITYRGEPGTYSMWVAMAGADPQVEFIAPISGPSIYDQWLETQGPGIHHLGLYVDDLAATDARMLSAGFDNVQAGDGTGVDGTGAFAYYDTLGVLGYYLEAIEVPTQRREPDYVWPDENDDPS